MIDEWAKNEHVGVWIEPTFSKTKHICTSNDQKSPVAHVVVMQIDTLIPRESQFVFD